MGVVRQDTCLNALRHGCTRPHLPVYALKATELSTRGRAAAIISSRAGRLTGVRTSLQKAIVRRIETEVGCPANSRLRLSCSVN